MPEEQTTLLQTHWSTEAMRVGCIAFEGMACMQDCGFAGSEQQLGFCSRCLWEAKCDNLDLDMCVRLNSPLFLLLTLLLSLILPLLLSSFLFRSFSIPGICNNGRNRSKNMIPFVINGGKRRGLKRHSTKAVGMLKWDFLREHSPSFLAWDNWISQRKRRFPLQHSLCLRLQQSLLCNVSFFERLFSKNIKSSPSVFSSPLSRFYTPLILSVL